MKIIERIKNSLIIQILLGMLLGCIFTVAFPEFTPLAETLGDLFIRALKSIAPILILLLVASAIANQQTNQQPKVRPIFFLYLAGTLAAAFLSVGMSFLAPVEVHLMDGLPSSNAPEGIRAVFVSILFKLVDNPINALIEGNYLGLIVWGVGLGLTLRHSTDSTKRIFLDISGCITQIVHFVIHLAPLGVFGLTVQTLSSSGFNGLLGHLHLLSLLMVTMAIFALIVNPLLVFIMTKQNPYPLLFFCLRESGIPAFFTRSSTANIPINIKICETLGLDKETYSVSIPLGAAMNTAGAAITVSILTLSAVHTLGIQVDFFSAVLLAIVSALCACGASGVAGGSLLLIPLAASLFGINNEVAMNIVAIGFMIGILQDAVETAVNSSTDVFYTAAILNRKSNKVSQEQPASET
ncbi:MAG: serine/threonine transporter SstT [Cellvibrionales bacterium]|nr:serine/threonine transporter SstT [Cellvibrionales bacterium]